MIYVSFYGLGPSRHQKTKGAPLFQTHFPTLCASVGPCKAISIIGLSHCWRDAYSQTLAHNFLSTGIVLDGFVLVMSVADL